MWGIAKLCVKWLKHLRNGLNMWEINQRFGNGLKYLGNG